MKKCRTPRSRDLARQRIDMLFELAGQADPIDPKRSARYVQIARNISTRLRVRLSPDLKRRFCKACGAYLSPSRNRVRVTGGRVVVTCLCCGKRRRYPYK
ncbi:MAG TPA: ribonuclease P [Methanotrichaceae archaeon]|nr:ribonuclease P [Methanotrichaceae archaeon]HQF16470.1 ribonuclease P [Methanotrichaceae archaeon]HQI91893.1 ribonuclease P [Methanotrichaceae archaeon]HQJ28450.1 ribonuclease P [Methanotrichaceae archaeon]